MMHEGSFGMSDNVLQTLQKLVQDVIAPDVRELKVRLDSFQRETESRFSGMDSRFTALEKQMDAHYMSLLAAIGQSKAQAELANMSEIYALRERVAALESQRA